VPATSVITDDKAKGEPPQWRWQDILATQRQKAAEEAEARIRQQYAWAEGIPPEARGRVHELLRGQQPAPPQRQDPMPEPDFQTADGVPFYSAPQQQKRDAWMARQILAQVEQRLDARAKPLEEGLATSTREREALQVTRDVQRFASAHPDFESLKPSIAAAIQADPALAELADRNTALALEVAYTRVSRPAQQQQAEASVLANLQQRAVAGTIAPNAATATTPKKFSQDEAGFAAALSHFGT
jgi:hypothetical protein